MIVLLMANLKGHEASGLSPFDSEMRDWRIWFYDGCQN